MSDRVVPVCFWVASASLVAFLGLVWWASVTPADQPYAYLIALMWGGLCVVVSLTALVVAVKTK